MTDFMNASDELPMFFLLASIAFLNLKYRIKPSIMIISPMIMTGGPTIVQKELFTTGPRVEPAIKKYNPVLM
jgi:hypothetical protein